MSIPSHPGAPAGGRPVLVGPRDAVPSVLALLPTGGPFVVAIDGLTGSGKSALAAALIRALPGVTRTGGPVRLVELERMVPGWDALEMGIARASALLRSVCAGREAAAETWDWGRMVPGPPLTVLAGTPCVLEGSGAFAAAAAPGSETSVPVVRVLVEAPAALRRSRILDRDPYAWDIAGWEAQEVRARAVWEGKPGLGPDVVVRH